MSSEADTRANYIDPALKATYWQPSNIIREHFFTDGRKLAGGIRGRRCFVDYLLHKDNRYLAVIEAKKESYSPTEEYSTSHRLCSKAARSLCLFK